VKIDTRSATWHIIKKHVEDKSATLRSRLESEVCWEETLRARAQLRALNDVLSLADDPEPPLVETNIELPY